MFKFFIWIPKHLKVITISLPTRNFHARFQENIFKFNSSILNFIHLNILNRYSGYFIQKLKHNIQLMLSFIIVILFINI